MNWRKQTERRLDQVAENIKVLHDGAKYLVMDPKKVEVYTGYLAAAMMRITDAWNVLIDKKEAANAGTGAGVPEAGVVGTAVAEGNKESGSPLAGVPVSPSNG